MDSAKDNTNDLTPEEIEEFLEWMHNNPGEFVAMLRELTPIESNTDDMQTIIGNKDSNAPKNPNLPEIEWFSWDGKKC